MIPAQFLRNVNELEHVIGDAVRTVDDRLWQIVQGTPMEDERETLEMLGAVALALMEKGEFRRACRWYEQLCDFSGAFAPWAEDTAWDYCNYAECLINIGNKEQATVWLENARGVVAMADAAEAKLEDRIQRLAGS